MADDWRVTFELSEDGGVLAKLTRSLHEREIERDARSRLGDRVAVSADEGHLFLYAGTEAAAREAEQVVSALLAEHQLRPAGDPVVQRWHPIEERWEDARVPLPFTAAERREEHERLEADETAESEGSGRAAWEVRIEFASHGDARGFADRLEGEGLPVVRRWTYVVVGADDEDAARGLARRFAGELPSGARVEVEPGGGEVWEVMGSNPFAFFGGLAG